MNTKKKTTKPRSQNVNFNSRLCNGSSGTGSVSRTVVYVTPVENHRIYHGSSLKVILPVLCKGPIMSVGFGQVLVFLGHNASKCKITNWINVGILCQITQKRLIRVH